MTDKELIAWLRGFADCLHGDRQQHEAKRIATAANRIEALAARVLKLEERLQITHMYRMDMATGEAVRYEVPPEERDSVPDKIACLEAEVELLEDDLAAERETVARLTEAIKIETEEKLNAISTLDAWFDRRKLGHEAVDQAVVDAASGYLRTSRNGGMEQEESDLILGVIQDMAHLGLFADLFARAALTQDSPAHVNETPKTEHDAGNVLTPAPDAAAIREALLSLPAVYAHQINTGVREVYDPLQRFYTMEDVLRALIVREADPVNRPMMTDLMVDPESIPDMEMEYDHRAGGDDE